MRKFSPLYRVLFVCTGNTCRSPLASASLKRALGDEGNRVEVVSAGVFASGGAPASALAAEVAGQNGIDLSAHRARRLENSDLESADLVFVMDHYALEIIRQRAPGLAKRMWLITQFGREEQQDEGIPDPFGGSREAYEECFHRIEEQIARIAPVVLREVRDREQNNATSPERREG